MTTTACTTPDSDHLANLRRLVLGRWIVLVLLAATTLAAASAFAIPVPQGPLLAVLGVALLINAVTAWRVRQADTASAWELFTQLLIDITTLSAVSFFSGGATNPLVSLLLPPVAIAALTLPTRCVAIIASVAIAVYSLLLFHYLPLPIADASRATRLHLGGMWFIFALSTLIVAGFALHMTRLIRQRDAELAAAREQALRDERVMAMGTLAAGAAHELGTPLAMMALLAGELAIDESLSANARTDIAHLRQQIGVCKNIITGLSRRAGAERLEATHTQAADRWLETLRQHWHASRPSATSRLFINSALPAPEILPDPRLEQAVLNLLNNAANATAAPVDISLAWNERQWVIEVRDQGPGFPAEVLAQAGFSSFAPHARGSGVGLMLTDSAISQLGGRLRLSNPDDGGALAHIELPRKKTATP